MSFLIGLYEVESYFWADYHLKPGSILLPALLLSCITSKGQTNVCAETSVWFFLDPVRLRTDVRTETDKPKRVVPPPSNQLPEKVSVLESSLADEGFYSSVVRDGEFYLTKSMPRSDSAVVRFVEDVFRPELIPLGKVTASSPIVTVIKRKNPLCLLSGISTRASPTGDGEIIFKLLELSW